MSSGRNLECTNHNIQLSSTCFGLLSYRLGCPYWRLVHYAIVWSYLSNALSADCFIYYKHSRLLSHQKRVVYLSYCFTISVYSTLTMVWPHTTYAKCPIRSFYFVCFCEIQNRKTSTFFLFRWNHVVEIKKGAVKKLTANQKEKELEFAK